MASSSYGSLTPEQMRNFSKQLLHAAAPVVNKWPFAVGMTAAQRWAKEHRPYPPGWKLGSIKRKGRPTIFLLWIDNVQMGPFNTMAARKRFIKTTLELQDAEPG